ncbi:hypothetical protein [Curtobacterium sp. MCPF17_052]|uniref:hypothetical protein n=1 Tax=Curtobacterium sp. MCPF17_052 TaxID=2175655 RepID=UPI0024DF3717|nr:hypothetical protein [Curtobacterium sp. MCPF17_052]WIB13792.1 hypothetical protein DEJ36_09075 [Curtobacterium sp. MCPF17_052]
MSDTFVGDELASQPASWRSAAALLPSFIDVLPPAGRARRRHRLRHELVHRDELRRRP